MSTTQSPTMPSPMSPDFSDSQSQVHLTIKVVRAIGLPKLDSLDCTRKTDGRFYGVLTIDDRSIETSIACRGGTPEWNESFAFHTRPSSRLRVDIYARRTMRKDQHIGFVSDTVGAICSSILAGGAKELSMTLNGDSKTRIDLYVVVQVDVQSEPSELLATKAGLTRSNTSPRQKYLVEIHTDLPKDEIPALVESTGVDLLRIRASPGIVEVITEGADFVPAAANVIDACKSLFNKIGIFCSLMDTVAEVHPYSKMAWSLISVLQKVLKSQIERDDRMQRLFTTMDSFYNIVDVLQKESRAIETRQDLLQRIAQQTTECCYFIRDYAKVKGFAKRTGKNLFSTTDDKINAFCDNFDRLKDEFDLGVAVHTEIAVVRILDEVHDLAMQRNLDDIPYAFDASFNEDKRCQSGTREAILDNIAEWINQEDAPRVLLLSGSAGTGKSAIAHTVAYRFKKMGRLGASFCFVRGRTDRGPDKLFSTIARDLADFDRRIGRALSEVVKDNKALRTTSNITQQFNNLIHKPIGALTLTGPIVIVIDALDESGDEASRKNLLEVLATRAKELPANLRILLTSRPEADIERLFQPNEEIRIERMDAIPKSSTKNDIKSYIYNRLDHLRGDGIDEECHGVLVSRCEGLFQWASVACEFIAGRKAGSTPKERYDVLIKGTTLEAWRLDELYTTVLSHLFQDDRAIERFKSVLSFVLAAFEPISIESLDVLLRSSQDGNFSFHPKIILEFMGSLLSGVNGKKPVRPLHTSFRDFLVDPSRSKGFHIDTSQIHKDFTVATMGIMNSQLSFNICHLESSYMLNRDVPNLADRIQEYIPAYLSYSCRFWASHLQHVPSGDTHVQTALALFLSQKLLFWIEVTSLLDMVHAAAQALSFLLRWCTSASHNTRELLKLAQDAHRFVNVFGAPISQSTPHMYISALPFSPPTSVISACFSDRVPRTLRVCNGGVTGWPTTQHIIDGGGLANPVAFSPDGTRIALGSLYSTIRIWDLSTGKAVGQSLEGHTSSILSIAFSPDGTRIVSGSSDNTIRMWDSSTRKLVGQPLEGHTSAVLSVAFSPDGTRIVSGSWDKTIRMWDSSTGRVVGQPLVGHTSAALSVTFSPDGTRIVSGSYDKTIRIWDPSTGKAVGQPLEGHSSAVLSVAFSPDGTQLVSGSSDNMIRIWDPSTGKVVGQPLEGHTSSVLSVTFSSDGTRIVSGSYDRTIRMWDSSSRKFVGQPFKGHTSAVWSAVFSPDGTRIVSCSDDNTIRMWDSSVGTVLGLTSKEHTDWVRSVAFSPDGTRIVSGSSDKTIRLWDASTGKAVGEPLEGHTGWVTSVAFSPDGTRIVSGSDDKMIRMWDSSTGIAVGQPLEGHTSAVLSVVFSPDGTHIVSTSYDNAIRIWDLSRAKVVGQSLKGHTNWVRSVVFSPDGTQIISGSDDKTIRVWDLSTGKMVRQPLVGHTTAVWSVAVSPDGTRIASGSSDTTIRIWDLSTGNVIGRPLRGHTSFVNSIAFSPDGTRIASGSWDTTIRIWDSSTGEAVGQPLEGHTSSVLSVAFSPDGKRIVSGSGDETIRVWNDTNINTVGRSHQAPLNQVELPLPSKLESAHPSDTESDLPKVSSELALYFAPLAFSSHVEHALPRVANLFGPAIPLDDNYYGSVKLRQDGWVVGPMEQLLFWVPFEVREKLWLPSRNSFTCGVELTELDLRHFVHGPSWSECYRHSAD